MAGAAKKASWTAAMSVGAVEALKDQAGLCRWDYALRSLYRRAKVAVPASLSSPASSVPAAGNGATGASAAAARARPTRPRRSEEEKLQKAHHLVCWGPN